MKQVTTDKVRRYFFDKGFCGYEIERSFVPVGLNEIEKVYLRLSNGRSVWSVGFGKEDKQTFIRFANDLLEMAEKL